MYMELKQWDSSDDYYKYMQDAYSPSRDSWFLNIVDKIKKIIGGIKTQWVSFDIGETSSVATPLKIIEELKSHILHDWPKDCNVRILIDRLDDSWDASKESQQLIIGLLKAANDINATFINKIIISIFLRSDIYDNLFFDDQDKLRQYEETLYWNTNDLKAIVCERVRVSLDLGGMSNDNIWDNLFSKKAYRSKASAEKYILDRTFKRPRDVISFVRFAIEIAERNTHTIIEPIDTRLAEEEKYSQSKYKDLIIEYQKQYSYVKDLLDSFSGTLHKLSQSELKKKINIFLQNRNISDQPVQIIRQLFIWGVIGIKRQGRAGVKQRGGAHFFYYYDDPSINPIAYDSYYIHPSLRYHLNISEKREKIKTS